MTTFGQYTYPEITTQYEALQAALEEVKQQTQWIEAFIGNESFDEVVFIGSGSSYYQSQTMAATYRKWTGRSASAWPSSELYLFKDQAFARNKKYLLVGVSRSGESSEVILAMESVQGDAAWTLCGVTCHSESRMAKLAPCLVSPLGSEKSTVMTRSFSSMTYMMQAAIAIAAKSSAWLDELEQAANQCQAVTAASEATVKAMVDANEFNKYVYLGMGAYFGIAQEACLKIKEMSYVWTESYGTLEFRHGPKSIVDQGTFLCVLVSEQARKHELKVAEEMKAYGAHVMLITAEAGEDTAFADDVIEVGHKAWSDEARTVLQLPALQYLGFYTALKLNVDPDEPRNLTQVVII